MNNNFRIGDIVYVDDIYTVPYIGVVDILYPDGYGSYMYNIKKLRNKKSYNEEIKEEVEERYIRFANDADYDMFKYSYL